MTSFSFGAPSNAPATTGLTGGFNFGASKPATTGFGLTATSQPSAGLFGTTPATSAPGFGAPSFGSTSFGANTTPGFGATSTPAFGASTPAFGAAAPAFGATAAPAFGATAAPAFGATAAPTFGVSTAAPAFGATAAPAFGATAAPTFGATAAPTFGASTAAPAFGTTTPAFGATVAPSFGTTPAPGLGISFGATTTPSFGLGTGGLNFGAGTNTSVANTGLSFGAPAATTASVGLGGFSFAPAATQTTAGFSFLNTSTATTSSSLFGPKLGGTSVTGTLPTTSVTASLGLGGVSNLTSGVGSTSTDAKNDPPKQQKLPNEILTTVDNFKNFVKKQKSLSSEVMRVSVKPLHMVSRQAEATLREALALQSAAARARGSARLQRHAAVTAIAAAEAAARDHAHPGSELEGSAPPSYVKELIAELEQKLIAFRSHMDSADKQMQSSPKLLTEQELNLGFRRMHESLVALAARLQGAHAAVEAQKEQYLNLRKYILKDPTNVFDNPTPTSTLDQILKDLDGGRKKVKSGTVDGSAVVADPRAALGSINLAGPSPFGYVGGLSPFPLADNSAPAWQPQATPVASTSLNTSAVSAADSGFQLQRPPGKRGKQ